LTGGVIGWQAWETRKAAEGAKEAALAAKVQVDAIKSKERARLALHPRPIEFIEPDGGLQWVTIDAENVGYSHAFNISIAARCEITMSESEPPDQVKESGAISMVRAQELVRRYRDDEEKPEFSVFISAADEIWKNVIRPGAKDLYAHLWGAVVYEDVFGDPHSIRFQYRFRIYSLGDADQSRAGIELPVSTVSVSLGWGKCQHPNHNHES
jgi:hypothetical protein